MIGDPAADPYLGLATCSTCGAQSPGPEPTYTITGQHHRAQRWCMAHTARHTAQAHPDGRHTRYTATVTLRWMITPSQEIGPTAP